MKGIGVSEGIGIGNAFVIKKHSLEYVSKTVTDTAAEIKRLQNALDVFCANTEKQAEMLQVSVGKKEAEILTGHIHIVRDPYLIAETEKSIRSGQCAEAAFESICDMFISIFSAADDELTRQRAADMRDIKSGVIGILLGADQMKTGILPDRTVIVAEELTPSMMSEINKERVVGIVTESGSMTSHTAILARAMEIPAVMGAAGVVSKVKNGDVIIVDGTIGEVIHLPSEAQTEHYRQKQKAAEQERRENEMFRGKQTLSADGTPFAVFCNIGSAEDAAKIAAFDGEGAGLFRTEFLFMEKEAAPTEEEQFHEYQKAALLLKDKPLVIRTLDIGGDKDLPYLHIDQEDNPFMGLRAIRYCLQNREIFKTQIRAIVRASAFGNIRMMFPMISCVEELRKGKELVKEVMAELSEEHIAFDPDLKIGIMVETAAAAVSADILAQECDFFSIGTNDLTGYMMACDRGNRSVADLYSAFQPCVLRMIKRTIECAKQCGIPVGMCGEAAADPMMIPLLMSFGLSEFSVSAPSVLKVRKYISRIHRQQADEIAQTAMQLLTLQEVCDYLKKDGILI